MLGKLAASYSEFPNATALIRNSHGVPARLYSTQSGNGLVSDVGVVQTDSSGSFEVYVDLAHTYSIEISYLGLRMDQTVLLTPAKTSSTGPVLSTPSSKVADLLGLLPRHARMALLREYWKGGVSLLGPTQTFVPTIGSVVYIDPTGSAGTGASIADTRNTFPALVANTTYLVRERTTVTSTANLTGITVGDVLLGTYDERTGARIFDKRRLATINGQTFFRASVRWQGLSGNFTLSGIRVTGGTNAVGGATGFECITAPSTSTVTIEHSVLEGIGAYLLSGGYLANYAIAISGPRLVVRFSRIIFPGDPISFSATPAGPGMEVYGNELVIQPSIAASGPDLIEMSRSGSNLFGRVAVYNNWMENNGNSKQGIYSSGGTPQASDSIYFAGNFVFGVDTLANQALPPDGQSHIAYNVDFPGNAVVVSNWFDEWAGWAAVGNNSVLMNNAGYKSHSGPFYVGFGTRSGATAARVANNTAFYAGEKAFAATEAAFEIVGSNHTVKNNAVVGAWPRGMRITATGTTESYNKFSGPLALVTNSSNEPIPLGVGTSIVEDPMLDRLLRPKLGSPLLLAAPSVLDGSLVPVNYEDPTGVSGRDMTVVNIGAMSGVAETV